MFKNISHLLEGVKVKIRGEDSNTSRTVKIQVIPSGILTDMVKESLNPRVHKECTKVMDEEGIPMTADPMTHFSKSQAGLVTHTVLQKMARTVQECMWYTGSPVTLDLLLSLLTLC